MPKLPLLLGATLAAFAAACDPPPKPPVTPAKVEEPPPPPPKCEALDEGCLAKAGTVASLPLLGWTIAPPSGWRYAQESEFTVVDRKDDKGAYLAATTVEGQKNPALLKKARIDAIELVARHGNVKLAQRNVIDFHLRDVPDKLEVAGLKLSIWEQEGAKRGDPKSGPPAPGNVVVVSGTVDGRELVMVAFAPKSKTGDAPESDALVTALQSLARKKTGGEGGKP